LPRRIEYLGAACDLRGIKRRQVGAYPPFSHTVGIGKVLLLFGGSTGRNPIYSLLRLQPVLAIQFGLEAASPMQRDEPRFAKGCRRR